MTDGANPSAPALCAVTVVPVNDPPAITVNTGVALDVGDSVTITTSMLAASDPDTASSSLTFTLLLPPGQGELRLSGAPLGINGTFDLDDLANSRLVYVHGGLSSTDDGFALAVDDGSDNGEPEVFALDVQGQMAPAITLPAGTLAWTEELRRCRSMAAPPASMPIRPASPAAI